MTVESNQRKYSYGSAATCRLDALKALRAELGLPVAAMLDTKGPEVRLKSFAAGSGYCTFQKVAFDLKKLAEYCLLYTSRCV